MLTGCARGACRTLVTFRERAMPARTVAIAPDDAAPDTADRDGDRPPSPERRRGLVKRAAHGDQAAWDALVARYTNLLWSVARGYRLERSRRRRRRPGRLAAARGAPPPAARPRAGRRLARHHRAPRVPAGDRRTRKRRAGRSTTTSSTGVPDDSAPVDAAPARRRGARPRLWQRVRADRRRAASACCASSWPTRRPATGGRPSADDAGRQHRPDAGPLPRPAARRSSTRASAATRARWHPMTGGARRRDAVTGCARWPGRPIPSRRTLAGSAPAAFGLYRFDQELAELLHDSAAEVTGVRAADQRTAEAGLVRRGRHRCRGADRRGGRGVPGHRDGHRRGDRRSRCRRRPPCTTLAPRRARAVPRSTRRHRGRPMRLEVRTDSGFTVMTPWVLVCEVRPATQISPCRSA